MLEEWKQTNLPDAIKANKMLAEDSYDDESGESDLSESSIGKVDERDDDELEFDEENSPQEIMEEIKAHEGSSSLNTSNSSQKSTRVIEFDE